MRYLRIYEDFEEIHSMCKYYSIKNYIINKDGSVDVDGYVHLNDQKLTKIPLKFNNVSGDFFCSQNKLATLEGCPSRVGGDFSCRDNQLITLEGGPTIVCGFFYCYGNKLKTLIGCPSSISGIFDCYNNQLTSLEGCPNIIGSDFYCYNNKITSFEGFPKHIGGYFHCSRNPINEIWELFNKTSKIELFNDYDIIRDDGKSIVLDRLNDFLEQIGKPTVEKVEGYNII